LNGTIDLLLQNAPEAEGRQLHGVDPTGETVAWTGKPCVDRAIPLSHSQIKLGSNPAIELLTQPKPVGTPINTNFQMKNSEL
jgi:uncharacterized Ntn-hydrolase superfamily protein